MTRLADRIRAEGFHTDQLVGAPATQEEAEHLAEQAAVVASAISAALDYPDGRPPAGFAAFDFTAVADQLLADGKDRAYDMRMPGVRPPYDAMWAEYTHPDRSHFGEAQVGAVICTWGVGEHPTNDAVGAEVFKLARRDAADFGVDAAELRWEMLLVACTRVRRRNLAGLGTFGFVLNDAGDIAGTGYLVPFGGDEIDQSCSSALLPILYGLSLLNCGNVTSSPHTAPAAVQRARRRRGRPPLTEYRTLNVHAPGVRRPARGAAPQSDAQVREHLRRGHFADYRNGPGLFGRPELRRRFWFSSTLVGDDAAGRVDKDYTVTPR